MFLWCLLLGAWRLFHVTRRSSLVTPHDSLVSFQNGSAGHDHAEACGKAPEPSAGHFATAGSRGASQRNCSVAKSDCCEGRQGSAAQGDAESRGGGEQVA